MVDQDYEGLSDEGRHLDDRLRNTVADLTGAPVRRGRRSGPGRLGFALAIFAVFVAVLIGALLTRSDDDRAIVETAPTPVPAGGLVPTPGPAQSSQSSGSSEPGPAQADCEVGDVVEVVAEATRTLPGSHDTTTYQGRVTFTNTGDEPVHLIHDVWLYTGPSGMDDRGWYGGPYLLEPGKTREELVNIGGSDERGYTWGMVTEFAVFGGSIECLDEYLQLGDAGYDALARPVANPFPVALPAA